jgi:acyl-CoA reductase-like NAD-dependent aldehyde dehydrogenase
MSNDLKFYINGEWVQSDSNELIDVINPANEEGYWSSYCRN